MREIRQSGSEGGAAQANALLLPLSQGDCPDELSVGQAQQQVLAEVLTEQKGSLLGAGGAQAT